MTLVKYQTNELDGDTVVQYNSEANKVIWHEENIIKRNCDRGTRVQRSNVHASYTLSVLTGTMNTSQARDTRPMSAIYAPRLT